MAISTQRWQAFVQITEITRPRCRMPSFASAGRTGLLACILAFSQWSLASTQDHQPDEDLTPAQVVRIVVDSLKHNDAGSDIGIATVFSFASPANKMNTGPLPRFATMIKRGFPDMLNHSSARYDPMEVEADIAIQAVWLMTPAGAEVGYAFQLSRQVDGEYAGMWMTDMVIPLGEGPGSGTRI